MKILIDNGHGVETRGKRSPDSRLREYAWTRALARRIADLLKDRGHRAQLLVPENEDVPLSERVRRANEITRLEGGPSNLLLVSIHVNAAGSGTKWSLAHGWSVFVAPNASARSRRLAEALASEAEKANLYVRRQNPGVGYWTQSLAIVRDTRCPAVLTENLFMDNRADLLYLLSDAGKEQLARLHADAIHEFILRES